jgi:hypothetical protein
MKTPITAARLRELLAYDPETGVLTRLTTKSRGDCVGTTDPRTGYMYIGVDYKRYGYHRVVWFHVHGSWPLGDIDHINGDRGDNRLSNLRDVPHQTNMQNKRKAMPGNRAGFLGVNPYLKKFVAAIEVNGKRIYLGVFPTPEEAHAAYVAAKRLHHAGNTL